MIFCSRKEHFCPQCLKLAIVEPNIHLNCPFMVVLAAVDHQISIGIRPIDSTLKLFRVLIERSLPSKILSCKSYLLCVGLIED